LQFAKPNLQSVFNLALQRTRPDAAVSGIFDEPVR
jgi:hypothetical protein